MGRQESGGKPGLDLQAESKLHVLELSWGEPERVANCIWNAHTDRHAAIRTTMATWA